MEKELYKNPNFIFNKNIISIFSKFYYSPFEDRFNILKLQFDDVTDEDKKNYPTEYIYFDEELAKKIHVFIDNMNLNFPLYIHCDAGISRSGAVGDVLNDYFNKYLGDNKEDSKYFNDNNNHIFPNSLVKRLLKEELFGKGFY